LKSSPSPSEGRELGIDVVNEIDIAILPQLLRRRGACD